MAPPPPVIDDGTECIQDLVYVYGQQVEGLQRSAIFLRDNCDFHAGVGLLMVYMKHRYDQAQESTFQALQAATDAVIATRDHVVQTQQDLRDCDREIADDLDNLTDTCEQIQICDLNGIDFNNSNTNSGGNMGGNTGGGSISMPAPPPMPIAPEPPVQPIVEPPIDDIDDPIEDPPEDGIDDPVEDPPEDGIDDPVEDPPEDGIDDPVEDPPEEDLARDTHELRERQEFVWPRKPVEPAPAPAPAPELSIEQREENWLQEQAMWEQRSADDPLGRTPEELRLAWESRERITLKEPSARAGASPTFGYDSARPSILPISVNFSVMAQTGGPQ